MLRSAVVLLLLALGGFALGRWTQADEEKPTAPLATVRALRYRIVWADSALDLSHGGGRWVHEIFLPDAQVTATLVFETQTTTDESASFELRPRAYVGRSDKPRTDLTGLSDAPPLPAKEVEVPAKLAKALAAFADLNDRYRAEGARLGTEFTATLGLKRLPSKWEAAAPAPGDSAPDAAK